MFNLCLKEHTIADFKFTKRWEFEQYLQWIVSHFANVKFNIKVEEVSKMQKISSLTDNEGTSKKFYARNVVLGTGVSPIIQKLFILTIQKMTYCY